MPRIYKSFFLERHEAINAALINVKQCNNYAEKRDNYSTFRDNYNNLHYKPQYQEIRAEIESYHYLSLLAMCYAQQEKIRNNKQQNNREGVLFDSVYNSLSNMMFFVYEPCFFQSFITNNPELANLSLDELKQLNDSQDRELIDKLYSKYLKDKNVPVSK